MIVKSVKYKVWNEQVIFPIITPIYLMIELEELTSSEKREREIPKCGVPSTKDSQKQRDRETERQL